MIACNLRKAGTVTLADPLEPGSGVGGHARTRRQPGSSQGQPTAGRSSCVRRPTRHSDAPQRAQKFHTKTNCSPGHTRYLVASSHPSLHTLNWNSSFETKTPHSAPSYISCIAIPRLHCSTTARRRQLRTIRSIPDCAPQIASTRSYPKIPPIPSSSAKPALSGPTLLAAMHR